MQSIIHTHKRIAVASSFFVLALSVINLAAYQFEEISIESLFPGQHLSNPVSALCFLLSVLSFFSLYSNAKKIQTAGKLIALFILLTGLIKCGEFVFDYNTWVDKWLYGEKLLQYGKFGKPNTMAPNTAFNFFILGLSLLLNHSIKRKNNWADYPAMLVALLSFFSIIGYLYNSIELYSIRSYTPMAFPTAISFFLLSAAHLFHRSQYGVLRSVTKKYEGSKMARFLLPFTVVVPVFTGTLIIYGEQVGWFTIAFGIALFASTNVLVFMFLIWRYSLFLNKSGKALAWEMEERKKLESQLLQLNKQLEKKVVERSQQLYKNEQRFRSLIENSVDIISIADHENRFIYVSPAIEKVMGIKPEEILGVTAQKFIHPDFEIIYRQLREAAMRQPGVPQSALLKVLQGKGHYIWIEGSMTNLLHDENVKGIVINFHDISARIQAEQQRKMLEKTLMNEQINQQKQLIRASVEGQEKEKRQIGMELHDNINQILTSIKLYLDIASSDKNMVDEMIEKGREQILCAINEIRNLSKTLVPHALENGSLIDAVKEMIQTIKLSSGIYFHSDLSKPVIEKLDKTQTVAVYRIIQEQFNNIVKHAEAKEVHIGLREEKGLVELHIMDDGRGFDIKRKRMGIGLSNIKSRVEILQGEMEIESKKACGCKLIIKFPLQTLARA